MNIDNNELKKHLEANLLDGDAVQAGQMIASSEVLEWAEDFFAAQRQALRDEVVGAIGEDEKPFDWRLNRGMKPDIITPAINQLRAELRTAISTIFEGKDTKLPQSKEKK